MLSLALALALTGCTTMQEASRAALLVAGGAIMTPMMTR